MSAALVGLMAAVTPISPSSSSLTLRGGGLLCPTPARAQGDADTERARQLFFEGVERMNERRWEEAAERFRATLALRSSTNVRYNLALALYELGLHAEAAGHLSAVMDDRSAAQAMRRDARRLYRQIAPGLGTLTVTVEGDIAGVELTLDGHPVPAERIGAAMPVDPGRHVLVASRGTLRGRQTVEVERGGAAAVTLRIPIAPTAEQAARAAEPGDEPGEAPLREPGGGGSIFASPWLWTAVGVVLVGVLVGGILLAPTDPDPVQGDLNPPLIEVRP